MLTLRAVKQALSSAAQGRLGSGSLSGRHRPLRARLARGTVPSLLCLTVQLGSVTYVHAVQRTSRRFQLVKPKLLFVTQSAALPLLPGR